MLNTEQNQMKKRIIIIDFLKNIYKNRIITIPVLILYFLGAFSVIIYRISLSNHAVADFSRDTLGYALRFILTKLTYYIPFSLSEIILLISPPCAVIILIKFIKKIKRSEHKRHKLREFYKGLCRFLALLCVLMFLFTFTLGIGYGATPVYDSIGLERRLISPEELAYAMRILVDEANAEAENIQTQYICAETGSTKMPYNLNELNNRLNRSFLNLNNLNKEYGFLKIIRIRTKPVIMSEILSRMHITGVASFYTAEANVNIIFPDYTRPFTAAHEMAHVMGISREDEANFTAFLACLYSDDSYIRYSGLLQMITYLQTPLFLADPDAYHEITGQLSSVIINEMAAMQLFFDKYRNQPIARVSTAVNDAYLRAQSGGREESEKNLGVATYGLVRDLAAIYLYDIYRK
jgi:hypothetical protein